MLKCDKCNVLFTNEKTIFIESRYIKEYGTCSKCYCSDLNRTKNEWKNMLSGSLKDHFEILDDILERKDEWLNTIKVLKDKKE